MLCQTNTIQMDIPVSGDIRNKVIIRFQGLYFITIDLTLSLAVFKSCCDRDIHIYDALVNTAVPGISDGHSIPGIITTHTGISKPLTGNIIVLSAWRCTIRIYLYNRSCFSCQERGAKIVFSVFYSFYITYSCILPLEIISTVHRQIRSRIGGGCKGFSFLLQIVCSCLIIIVSTWLSIDTDPVLLIYNIYNCS